MPQVILTHDDTVDDFGTLASGVRLGGQVHIGQCAYLGAGAMVREARTVGAYALIGMGAVVTTDIPANEVWAGVPARYLRAADVRDSPADRVASAVLADRPAVHSYGEGSEDGRQHGPIDGGGTWP
jgi:acetyltransferase-like isoleucine patch superfamily enzyme